MQKMIIVLIMTLLLCACATGKYTDPCRDPYEPFNRAVFGFNMALDKIIFRPVAKLYDTVVPGPICHGIGNFFDNLDDVTNVANNVLQLKFYDAWSDCWRIAFNTAFGLLGLFDVATCAGLPKHHQDFGLTLAYWGVTKTPYFMVPFFGPSTIRDTIAWPVDWYYLSVWGYIHSKKLRYGLYALRLVHKRACLLPADKLIDDSLDPYIFVRDAYLQRRECEVNKTIDYKSDECSETHNGTDKDDTFVAETTNGDSADTFVSAEANVDSGDTFVAEDPKTESSKQNKTAKSDDTYVEP